jgi:hypothetical protein
MRLYLLPVSTRRILLYCHRHDLAATEPQSIVDKVQSRAAKIWTGWERKEKGWQKQVVSYGNYGMARTGWFWRVRDVLWADYLVTSSPAHSVRRMGLEVCATSVKEARGGGG